MKIIKPSIEIMRTGLELEPLQPEQFIEKVGRTCYKSEDKITPDSAAKFVQGLITRGHEAMIEHWSFIFKTDAGWYEDIVSDYEMLMHNLNVPLTENLRPYLRFTDHQDENNKMRCVISGNIRAWRDFVYACVHGFGFIPAYLYGVIKANPLFFPGFKDWVPVAVVNDILIPISVSELTPAERMIHQDVTVKFICDRGVSHEIVRHRVASFAQESTRYCNYGLDKFGNEITVVAPSWCEEGSIQFDVWAESCVSDQIAYFELLKMGCTPQQARSVLPSSLKTEVIVTMNLSNWQHFFELRCAPDAHPDIQVVAKMARNELVGDGIIESGLLGD